MLIDIVRGVVCCWGGRCLKNGGLRNAKSGGDRPNFGDIISYW